MVCMTENKDKDKWYLAHLVYLTFNILTHFLVIYVKSHTSFRKHQMQSNFMTHANDLLSIGKYVAVMQNLHTSTPVSFLVFQLR